MCLIHHLGGASKYQPEDLEQRISSQGRGLIARAFEDIDPAKLVDYHMHVAGLGAGDSGAFVNPKMLSWRHPFHRLKFRVYVSAGGVKDERAADQQFVKRIVRLARASPGKGKYKLLAFDKNYNRDGTENFHKTEFYVPNDYVLRFAARTLTFLSR